MVPGIWTGDERNTRSFCPSCPSKLRPHTHSVPSVLVANECVLPLLTELHVVPGICTGDERYVVIFCPSSTS